VGTLRNLVINNVRCGNLIYCCYSVYELLELLSESIPSEDREETAVIGDRVSQLSVIGRWLKPPRVRTASCVFLTRKHIFSQICRASFWCVFVWKHNLASCEEAGNSEFRNKSVLFSETTRPPTDVCTAIPSSLRSLAIVGMNFRKEEIPNLPT